MAQRFSRRQIPAAAGMTRQYARFAGSTTGKLPGTFLLRGRQQRSRVLIGTRKLYKPGEVQRVVVRLCRARPSSEATVARRHADGSPVLGLTAWEQ
jgi:hypothetical protein